MTNDEVLRHFGVTQEFRSNWEHCQQEQKRLFCRLASAVHNAGLDWYYIEGRKDFRFGRKETGVRDASSRAGSVSFRNNQIRVRSHRTQKGVQINSIPEDALTELNVELMERIEDELKDPNVIPKHLREEREGRWPGLYQSLASEAGQETELRSAEVSSSHSLNTILYGPPGTGKTYATFRWCVVVCDKAAPPDDDDKAIGDRFRKLVEEGRVEFVTFHQSYGYEEFVEGLRPQTGSTDSENGINAGFRLAPEDGVLKRIAERARKVRAPYVLVIDEINRANISKVFGEAITLVEEDKRAGKPNGIPITLPYSGKPFILPPNLYILGTMNTADRSIALLDTALRRRFDFEEVPPKPDVLGKADDIDLENVLNAMNKRLKWYLSRDHLIGHAWLIEADDRKKLDRIMRNKIIPMLAEYFHDDWGKVRAVLGGGDQFIEREKLDTPPEPDNADMGEDRYSWTVRREFPNDAYDRLIAGKAQQADARDDGTEDDNA